MDNVTMQIQSAIISLTDKIMAFLPSDLFVRLILVMITLVVVFGVTSLFTKNDDQTKDTN